MHSFKALNYFVVEVSLEKQLNLKMSFIEAVKNEIDLFDFLFDCSFNWRAYLEKNFELALPFLNHWLFQQLSLPENKEAAE